MTARINSEFPRFSVFLSCMAMLMSSACTPTEPPVTAPALPTGPKTIFYDNFDTVKGEWQQSSGVWEVLGGFLTQKTDDPRQLNSIRYVQAPRIADGTIETQVRINPDRPQMMLNTEQDAELARGIRYIIGAGIVFRIKDPQNYYMFRLAGEEGAVLGRMIDGQWNEQDLCNPRVRDFLEGARIGFRRDNWYRLKVEAYGNQITAYINDEPVCRASDDTFGIGQVGLVTFKTAADFDYFKVTNKYE